MNKRKQIKHFKKMINGVEHTICDHEFKRYKIRSEREAIRQNYDSIQSKLDLLNTQIESEKEKKTLEKGERARLDDQKILLEKDTETYLEQMRILDAEVEGLAPSKDYPQGIKGVNGQLDQLHELIAIIKDYIKVL